ncbi:MAG: hypothetical protein HY815_07600 [Candidatus Riflebacteria bacterium]|nr:hypothetical protein [Candidatus Riflebacteria bacterium]
MQSPFTQARPLLTFRDLAALVLLAVLALGFHRESILGGKVINGDDALLQNLPQAQILNRSVRAGTVPFWSGLAFTGYPLYAEGQAGAFYLPTVLCHRYLDAVRAFNLDLFVHHLLLAMLIFLLSRQLGVGLLAALGASMAFSFGGFVVGHLVHLNLVRCLPYLPLLIMIALRRHVRDAAWTLREVVFTGASLGLLLLAGHLQTALSIMILWAGWIGFLEVAAPRPGRFWLDRVVPRVLPALLLGLLLAAIQLVPTLQLLGESIRNRACSWTELARWSVGPGQLLNLIVPLFLGTPRDDAPYIGAGNFQEFACYVGIVPLLLVGLVPPWRLSTPLRGYFTTIGLVGLLLALGAYSPLAPLWTIPPLSFFRNPCRFLLWVDFALVILASFSLDEILRTCPPASVQGGLRRVELWRVVRGGLVTISILALGYGICSPLVRSRFSVVPRTVVVRDDRSDFSAENLRVDAVSRLRLTLLGGVRGLTVALVVLGIAHTLVWLKVEGHMTPTMCALWLTVLVAVDVPGLFATRVWERVALDRLLVDLAPVNVVRAAAPENRTFVNPFDSVRPLSDFVRFRFHWAAVWDSIPMVGGYAPLAPRRWVEFFSEADRPVASDMDQALAVLARIDPVADAWKLRLAGARYLISASAVTSPDWVPSMVQDGMGLYTLRRPLPRAYLVRALKPLAAGVPEGPTLKVLNATLPTVTIHRSDGQRVVAAAVTSPRDSILVEEPREGEFLALVNLRAPGWMVFPDLFYPGWEAHIDGVAAPLSPACGFLQAVEVPAGIHEIRMVFDPGVFRLGALITIAGLGVVFGILVFGLLYRGRRVGTNP